MGSRHFSHHCTRNNAWIGWIWIHFCVRLPHPGETDTLVALHNLRQPLLWKCYIMWNIHSCQMSELSGRLKHTLCRLCLAVVSLFANGKHTKQMRSRLPANEVCSREQQSALKSTAQTRITHTLSIQTTASTLTHTISGRQGCRVFSKCKQCF